ncbi:MAG: hypothetical protein ACK5S6_00425 [bacterium]|jgi:hypothetical protein
MPRSSKGGAFERDISRQLSLWWSGGQHDDWFWRTGGSGGRATNRAKSGKETVNGYGDIMAQCGEAQKLLDVVTIECKKGYNIVSISDLLDLKSGGTMQKFIDQATKAASLAGTPHWAIIHKRDRRETLLITNCLEFAGPSWSAQRLMLDDDILIAPLDLCLTPLTRSKLRDMQ